MSFKKIGEVVEKILQKTPCQQHQKQFLFYSPITQQIKCESCLENHYEAKIKIKDIMNNPILAMDGIFSLLESSNNLQCMNKIKSMTKAKKTFEIFVKNIEDKVKTYCSRLIQKFNKKWESAIQNSSNEWETLERMETSYREGFETLLSEYFIEGTPQELENILRIFGNQNEDPSQALVKVLGKIGENITEYPYVNWKKMEEIFETVADPMLWKTEGIILSVQNPQFQCQKQNILLPNFDNLLSDGIHKLHFNSQEITLSLNVQHPDSLQNLPQLKLKTLKNETNDSIIEISGSRLLGIDYTGIRLYKYSLDSLIKQKQYEVSGCTHYLLYKNCLILIASSRLMRLWLSDGKQEILGFNYTSIKCSNEEGKFICIDGEGRSHVRSFEHNIC